MSVEYIEYHYKILEHFANIAYSSKSIWQQANDNIYARMKNFRELIRGHTLQGEKVFNLHFQIKNGESKFKTIKSYLCIGHK